MFGAREALQLLGVAYVASRALGWVDLGEVEEVLGDSEADGLEDVAGAELPPNPGDQYVQSHNRDGRFVEGYYRTNADATHLNNYSGPNGDLYRRMNGRG